MDGTGSVTDREPNDEVRRKKRIGRYRKEVLLPKKFLFIREELYGLTLAKKM